MNIYDFQKKWRKPLYFIGLFFAVVCLILELLVYFIPSLRNQMNCSDTEFLVRYVIIPTCANVFALMTSAILLLSDKLTQRGRNVVICGLLLWICVVIENVHGHYPAVLCLPCMAIFISTIFANTKTTYIMTIVSLLSTFSSYLITKELFGDVYITLANYIIACAVIIMSYFCSQLLIRYIFTQLVTVSEGVKNEKSLLNKMKLDPLTGLYNRGGMDSIINELISHYSPECRLYVLMIDIDNFKRVNDVYGHQNGDVVLRTLAQLIMDMGRKDIIPCRYGGEEIVIIFKNHTPEEAYNKGRVLLSNFGETVFEFDPDKRITFSGGFSEYVPNMTADDWIKDADEKLYYAKNNGKNQIKK